MLLWFSYWSSSCTAVFYKYTLIKKKNFVLFIWPRPWLHPKQTEGGGPCLCLLHPGRAFLPEHDLGTLADHTWTPSLRKIQNSPCFFGFELSVSGQLAFLGCLSELWWTPALAKTCLTQFCHGQLSKVPRVAGCSWCDERKQKGQLGKPRLGRCVFQSFLPLPILF